MPAPQFRRLRALVRNAITWGIAWAAIGGAIVTTITLVSPSTDSLVAHVGRALAIGAMYGVRFGIAGSVIGGLFAGVVRFGYRGRRLADIDPVRFGLLGAVVGGLGVPLFLQLMNVLSGDGPIAWNLVTDDALWAAPFGAAVAAGSILLARRADASPDARRDDGLADADVMPGLSAAEQREVPIHDRARVTRR